MDILYPHRKFAGNATELSEQAVECASNFGWPVDPDKTNERLVRYYVAEGVIDRPERQGREATYGFRHLLQLLSARRMIEAGMSLSVIGRHNLLTATQALEEGLTQPIPTEAEILVNSFKSPDASRNFFAKSKPAQPPTPLAIPDVLHEVKRMKEDWMSEISFVKKLRHDFADLRAEMEHHRNLVTKAQESLHSSLGKMTHISVQRDQEFMSHVGQLIERHTHEVRARYQEMGSVVAQAQEDFSARLSELKDRQDQLIEMVQRLQHKIDAS